MGHTASTPCQDVQMRWEEAEVSHIGELEPQLLDLLEHFVPASENVAA
jgi:hypothetical protein